MQSERFELEGSVPTEKVDGPVMESDDVNETSHEIARHSYSNAESSLQVDPTKTVKFCLFVHN